jgi:hypothetical protein
LHANPSSTVDLFLPTKSNFQLDYTEPFGMESDLMNSQNANRTITTSMMTFQRKRKIKKGHPVKNPTMRALFAQ